MKSSVWNHGAIITIILSVIRENIYRGSQPNTNNTHPVLNLGIKVKINAGNPKCFMSTGNKMLVSLLLST